MLEVLMLHYVQQTRTWQLNVMLLKYILCFCVGREKSPVFGLGFAVLCPFSIWTPTQRSIGEVAKFHLKYCRLHRRNKVPAPEPIRQVGRVFGTCTVWLWR
jgi:hypothetical protein